MHKLTRSSMLSVVFFDLLETVTYRRLPVPAEFSFATLHTVVNFPFWNPLMFCGFVRVEIHLNIPLHVASGLMLSIFGLAFVASDNVIFVTT